MRVYLAGAINGMSDVDANAWRQYVKERLHCETSDPMDRDYRGQQYPGIESDIVLEDLDAIMQCDVMLAYCPFPSWGTAMEIAIASREFDMWIIAVVPSGRGSPWLSYHVHEMLSTLDEAILMINAEAD